MATTTSPKIIFVPFLICSISKAGQNFALLFGKEKAAIAFHKLFSAGFLLFWFGFLAAAGYISVRDRKYTLLLFSIPFWLVGIFLTKNRLLYDKSGKRGKSREAAGAKFEFPIIISAILVAAALLAGIAILIIGIMDGSAGMIFAGAFFVFGAAAFILAFLMLQG